MNREHAPYFFVSPTALEGTIVLEGDDARHLAIVRRARPGDTVRVADGSGYVAQVSLTAIDQESATGRVITKRYVPKTKPDVTVIQAMTKGAKVDSIVQKLVEIGVDRICIVTSDRSIVRWDEARRAKASGRLTAIGIEAAKQSHRAWLPQVVGPSSFELAVSEIASAELSLVAHPAAERSLSELMVKPVDRIALAVGPEGGWSSDELQALRAAGGEAMTVGDQVLRSETAPLVIGALVMHRAGRLG